MDGERWGIGILLFLLLPLNAWAAKAGEERVMEVTQTPAGYTLQDYIDCGVPTRQAHVPTNAAHTFTPQEVNADEQARTVTYGTPHFDVAYGDLDASVSYLLAVTYASEQGNRRVQSLTANGHIVHGPRALPDGTAQRFLFQLPRDVVDKGNLQLHFNCEEGHNAVASVIELWAPLPEPKVIALEVEPRITGHLTGTVANLAWEGLPDAEVSARIGDDPTPATATTGPDGHFDLDLSARVKPGDTGSVHVVADHQGRQIQTDVALADLAFVEPRITPRAKQVAGTDACEIVLDGTWRICPAPKVGFESAPTDGAGWPEFTVPGQWLQQGFDFSRDSTLGLATDFVTPDLWRGMLVHLRFDAVHGGAKYWLNGKPIGSSENLFTPVELDITKVVRVGEPNHLAMSIVVDTPSELASFSSNYAFHNLGGIDRSVRVCALPPIHIADLRWDTQFDKDYKDAVLALSLGIANMKPCPAQDLSVEVKLTGPLPHHRKIITERFTVADIADSEAAVSKELSIPNPAKWNAEQPNLYGLSVALLQGGKMLEQIERRLGFRDVKTHDSQLWVNGQRVKLAGVNRHEIDPLTGRAATAKHAMEDARLLKGANFNYVRTSHYPPTPEFLDACDEVGLYVECEAPFCWARGGHGENDVRRLRDFLTPTVEMLREHRGHPSIIIWSIANESGGVPGNLNALPKNFATNLDYVHRIDPSRPVLFNNEWALDGGACDIAVLHYPTWPPEDSKFVKDDPRPILIDEYFPPQTFTFAETLKRNPGLDVVNWSTGQNSPKSFWSDVYKSKRVIGGAIWAGIDEEFLLPGGKIAGYGAWGFIDAWRRPKSLWWDSKRVHSPVWIPTRRVDWHPGQDKVQVPIENRYAFTDLSALNVHWELGKKKGRCHVALGPGANGFIEVPIPKHARTGDLLVLRFFDANDELITAHGVTLGDPVIPSPPKPEAGCPEWKQDDAAITVAGNGFQFTLDRATAKMREGSIRINALPRLFITRLEEQNVFNPKGLPYAEYPDESARVIDSISAEARGNALAIVMRDHFTGYQGSTELLIDRHGQCRVSFDYAYSGEAFTIGEIGLRFETNEACREIQWRRHSEWDVYPEDHIGRPEGRAEATGPAGPAPYTAKPAWPWRFDVNEFGTRDFRAAKYNIYEAALTAPDGSGLRVDSDATTDVRPCLGNGEVYLHVLNSIPTSASALPWPLGVPPRRLAPGDHASGSFAVRFLEAKPSR